MVARLAPHHLALVKRIVHQRLPCVNAWVYGSRATGKARAFSDLDLAIKGDQLLDFNSLALLDEDFVESDLPIKVDVV